MKNKMKTSKSVAKRFRVTKNGKILHACANRSHKNYHKSGSRKRRLDVGSELQSADKKRIRRALGI
jgi:large subunit ribosomal protein L35